ncbi:uncharacterized protein LOC124151923 [Haliotis rufescens]|uniref:uncharacterized protein LOC124151923 n=1 Tax=Haliotis rufescens TaxID=6454 RepID=UPI00201EF2AF|nr:uncharacterized protein LOC124151923 [Haliotis rufescens]
MMVCSNIVWGYIISCVLTTIGSSLKTPLPGQRRCLDMSNAAGEQVSLRCKSRKNIIFGINVMCFTNSSTGDTTSIRRRRFDSSSTITRGKCGAQCSGYQLDVLAASYDCYWKAACNITWSTSPILKSPHGNCIMKVPSYLSVRYKCIRKKRVYFLSNNLGHGLAHRTRKSSDYGIIVSHENYPWVYRTGGISTMTLSPKARRKRNTSRANKVLITVNVLDIGQHDAVVVNSSSTTQMLVKGSSIVLDNTETFSVQLLVSSEDSSRQGFLLCFYWARKCENISGNNACKIVRSHKRRRRLRRCEG